MVQFTHGKIDSCLQKSNVIHPVGHQRTVQKPVRFTVANTARTKR